ncbi:MAG: hypothetical protein OIN66_08825 [Candidatus Methanoperedens sp.]|nr:hypothetical protein [Candidatus Methanoperedens sp.]
MGFSLKGKSIFGILFEILKHGYIIFVTLSLILSLIATFVFGFYFNFYFVLGYILLLIILFFIFSYGNDINIKYPIFKGKFVEFALVILGLVIVILIAQDTIILNSEQKNFAEKAAQISLRNDKLCDTCEVSVSSFGEIKSTAKGDRKIAKVTFTQGEMIIYLGIDLDNGTVVEKRQTTKAQEAYDKTIICC